MDLELLNNTERGLEQTKMELSNNSLEVTKGQDSFLNKLFKNAIEEGINLGIKALLPDIIEDQVIDIKDGIIEGGFKEGASVFVNKVKEFGNAVSGIFTGNFNNINALELATKNSGILKLFSKGLSLGIDYAINSGKINSTMGSILKSGKTALINKFADKLETNITKEMKKFDKLKSLQSKWDEALEDRDIDRMNKYVDKINELSKETVPFENILNRTHQINELHDWMKKNNSFDYAVDVNGALMKLN